MAEFLEWPECFLKLAKVCRHVGLGKSMIYDKIRPGRFLRLYKISPVASRWSEREVVASIDDVKDRFEGKRRKVRAGGEFYRTVGSEGARSHARGATLDRNRPRSRMRLSVALRVSCSPGFSNRGKRPERNDRRRSPLTGSNCSQF